MQPAYNVFTINPMQNPILYIYQYRVLHGIDGIDILGIYT